MAKKLSFLVAAVAVLAFAVPAMASAAAPTLHYAPGGGLVPTGSSIAGTGTNITLTSSTLGEIKCEKLTLNGTLTTNNTTSGIAGHGPEKGEEPNQTNCKNGTNTVKVTNVTLKSLTSTTNGIATASFTSVVDIGASTTCTFTGTNVTGSYANHGNTLTFSGATGITSSPVACGTAKLDGSFVLEEINKEGKAVALEAVFG